MKQILVTWFDAVSQDEWTDIEEAKKLEPHVITTLGWLVFEDEKRLVVSCSHDKEREAVASSWAIPKSWVVEIKEIA